MTCLQSSTALVLLMVLTGAAPQQQSSDANQLEGTWDIVSMEQDGAKQTPESAQLRLTGDTAAIRIAGNDTQKFRFKVDPSKNPKHLDWIVEIEAGKPIVQEGIYKLKGDNLELHVAAAGKPRPKELQSKRGDTSSSMVLKRSQSK